ncbi:unnamed protein product, partial [Closterium sp. Naga37s-1]
DLYNKNMLGSLPPSIGDLSRLSSLVLEGNQFSGELPASLDSLVSLEFLDLGANHFRGTIPCFGSLTKLWYLYFYKSSFSGTIPDCLSKLTSLRYINLAYNDLSGSLPASIGNLDVLQSLSLGRNSLNGTIPDIFSGLSSITHLTLGYNRFFGPFPNVASLNRLDFLDLSYNYLTGSIPTLANSTLLDIFLISGNHFTSGTITSKICSKATVQVWRNCFAADDVPCKLEQEQRSDCADFCGMIAPSVDPCNGHGYCYGGDWRTWQDRNLTCECFDQYVLGPTARSCVTESSQDEVLKGLLTLWNSIIDGPWKNKTLESLRPFVKYDSDTFIVSLELSNQSLSGTIPSILSQLSRLTHLDLSHNYLSGSIPSSFSKLDGLQTLNLGSNYLYEGTLPTTMCNSPSPLTLSLHDNCFPSDALPCALTDAQRPSYDCSTFCGLSPPSTPPCAGHGNCFWEGGEGPVTATCACDEGFGTGIVSGSCAPLLPDTEWSNLQPLMAAWGGFDGSGTWKSGVSCESMKFIACDSTNQIDLLNVSGQGIWGSIPDTISDLASLTLLDLSGNYLTGSLPSSLSSLWNLDVLSLNNNYLYSGTLFKTTCRLKLSLEDNCFPSTTVLCPLRTYTQRPSKDCSAFCGLSVPAPTTPPCSGHGYCFWKGEADTRTAMCACGEEYGNGVDPTTCKTRLPEKEWLVLNDLKTAWVGFEGGGTWNESTPCERLEYVTCNANNHIVALNVSKQGIVGFIPSSIQDLVYLTSLNLSKNAIAGPIPDSFSRLTLLQILDMSHNQLSGGIPSGFSKLQKLVKLDLSSNYLYSGTLPTTMCTLSSTLALSLQDNCFPAGRLPCALSHTQRSSVKCSAFCDLSPPAILPCSGRGYCFWKGGEDSGSATCACGGNIETGGNFRACDGILLNSEWKALQAIKDTWKGYDGNGTWRQDTRCDDMANITCNKNYHIVSLRVNYSAVAGRIPALLGNLIHLTELDLSNNRLSGTFPSTIAQLTNLVNLNLRSNLFKGDLPGAFSGLTLLKKLDIGANEFTGQIPEWICNMTSLTYLMLGENIFDGPIPECMSNLTKLITLSLQRNHFFGKVPSYLGSFSSLTNLDLGDNRFWGSIPSSILLMKSIRKVSLHNNMLSGALVVPPPKVTLTAYHNYLSVFSLKTKSCKKGLLEGNCFNFGKTSKCSKIRQRPMSECTPFCGLSRKSPPCGGFGTCIRNGTAERLVCDCKKGYVQGESLATCIPEAMGNPRSTTLIPTMVTLTELTAPSNGSFFSDTRLQLFSYETIGGSCGRQFYFKASFSFIMIPRTRGSGGNGLAFVVSATNKTTSTIGSGVGYAGMSTRSMAVEFDTWQDKEHNDTSASHVGVNLNGNSLSNVTANTSTVPLNNGKMYFAWVEYNPDDKAESLKVYLADSFSARPVDPMVSMNLSLCDVLEPTNKSYSFYFGFVAASGLHAQKHAVGMASIITGYNLPPPLPVKRSMGLLVDVATFNPQTTSPFTRYVSVGHTKAQDDQDTWRIPTYSTWTIDPNWLPKDQGSC